MEYALSLGSNLGWRLKNIQKARDLVLSIPGVRAAAQSPVYETEPQDVPAEHRRRKFLNAVLVVESRRLPRLFSRDIHAIETAMGRTRSACRNVPRIVDIDIIFAGCRSVNRPGLKIPHPRWSQRRFVVQPLCDIRPTRRLPGERRTVQQVLADLPVRPRVVLHAREW